MSLIIIATIDVDSFHGARLVGDLILGLCVL